jgi:hypothetical protein
MFGSALALVYGYRLMVGNPADSLIELPLIILGTGVGGGIGVRVASVGWRQTAFAALLSGVGLIMYARFERSFPGPWIPAGSGMELDLTSALSYLVIGTAGVFLLPLFDPAVRQAVPAPSVAKVVLVAVPLTVLAILVDYLLGGGSFFGLLTLIFGSIASAVLVGVGMILALVNLTAVGAWLGGLGLVLEALIVAAWWLLGSAWFP